VVGLSDPCGVGLSQYEMFVGQTVTVSDGAGRSVTVSNGGVAQSSRHRTFRSLDQSRLYKEMLLLMFGFGVFDLVEVRAREFDQLYMYAPTAVA
jgi:hypothetical protein